MADQWQAATSHREENGKKKNLGWHFDRSFAPSWVSLTIGGAKWDRHMRFARFAITQRHISAIGGMYMKTIRHVMPSAVLGAA
ncbi:MAG TPA: hypothetical protein VLW50_08900, partial [Streptosporangiaceae bacterium]|nr:hypothetical protein [Streptosporangiaceae bacterium]